MRAEHNRAGKEHSGATREFHFVDTFFNSIFAWSFLYISGTVFFFLSPLKHIPFDEPEYLSSNPSQTPSIHDYHHHLLRTWSTKLVMSGCLSLSFESLCEL